MERMSGIDASFLYFETPNMHMHVVATIVHDPTSVPEGYSFDKVKEMIRSRLHLAKPLRRRLMTTPLNLGHPVWVEDLDFDLDYHVRRIGCPSPGTEEQLSEIVGDIASRPLDRTRPLWEVWIVEGLENGFVAAIAKMHHCTIDGVSGANMMVHFFDLSAEGADRELAPLESWKPDRKPSDLELLGRAMLARAQRPFNWVRVVPATVKSVAGFIAARRRTEGPGMSTPLTAPRTSFNTTITPHRRVAYTHVPLGDVKTIKRTFGTTVNDAVLAIVSGALRRYLESRDELPDKSLIAAVPVSVRTEEEKDIISNRVSAMFSTLATDVDDPVERLKLISEANKGAKEEHKAIGADMLTKWGELAAPTTFSLAARFYSGLKLAERHPVVHNLVISNVPGPSFPLYFAGAKLVAMYPLGPIFDGAGLNVTVLSYMDQLFFGLIGCREIVDVWGIAGYITESFAELRKAADAAQAGA